MITAAISDRTAQWSADFSPLVNPGIITAATRSPAIIMAKRCVPETSFTSNQAHSHKTSALTRQ